jgi:predicted DNA-binding transcriptional regulator YafY
MPASKYAHTRYQVINSCLTSKVKKLWSSSELLHKLEEHDIAVSRRTLQTDIETMRFDERLGYYAPIAFNKLRGGFYYDKDDYSINTFSLSPEEMGALVFAREFIRPFLHLSALRKFEPLINKLMRYAHATPPSSPLQILVDEPNFGCDPTLVDRLLTLMHEKVACRIAVSGLATGKTEHLFFHPYWLHQVGDTWHFGGRIDNGPASKIAFFPLRQLKSIVATHHEFIRCEI